MHCSTRSRRRMSPNASPACDAQLQACGFRRRLLAARIRQQPVHPLHLRRLSAKALDPPLRVLVETGYDRTINPGQPTPARYTYFPNPFKTLVDFAVAIPTGWDDAISYVTGGGARPFGTAPQPVYGVGGPPVYAGAVDPYVDPAVPAALQPGGSTNQGDRKPNRMTRAETSSRGYAGNRRGYRTTHDDPRKRATPSEGLSHRGGHRR